LQATYLQVLESEAFRREYDELLRDYVGRPSPLYLTRRLSRKYGCRLYLKREDLNHTGAHKINNTIGQILLARRMGKTRIIAETGAGQHGVATATVCALMDMECVVYMGKLDVERQHINVQKMEMLGATVVPVTSGNMTLKDATNEAIRDWCCHPADTYYIIGSTVGPHPYPDMVARLQSVISEEIKKQLQEKEGRDYPDYLIACVGGGSNAAGTIYHYLDDERVKIVLAEAGGEGIASGRSAATIQLGKRGIIHGSRTLVMQSEDGQIEEPYSISAGLDYPGIGPMHAHLSATKRATVLPVNDDEALAAAFELTRLEGIIPALESAHALGALNKLKFKEDDIVVLTLSGRGDKDIEQLLNHQNK
jgi:tryptophan synthase beta chain